MATPFNSASASSLPRIYSFSWVTDRTCCAIKGSYLSSYEIRPAGRHVLTIGEELIQDEYAAIVELVKNCYDADSPDATIVFRRIATDDCLEIQVIDHGHGMSTDDIINKWLVPSKKK